MEAGDAKLGDACEARTWKSDCADRCTTTARHWTHVLDAPAVSPHSHGRRVLCTQHFKVLQRYQRRSTERALFSAWRWLS